MGAGGVVMNGPWGTTVSANITPHADGVRDWTDAELETAIRKGIRRDGGQLMPPMGYSYYSAINAPDMSALIAYLRSIPPKPSPK